ncbi:MAG: cytochrome c biogenesis protein CcdA [Chloroflexi bacterium]|nr:cytochrome c biogenesis protein CcdA [Chloroflexota bacterium]
MLELPVLFAFQAGMLTTVSPCGFAMLPAYVSYHLGIREPGYGETPLPLRLLKALLAGAFATAGFILLFGSIGLLISLGGRFIIPFVPGAALAVGVLLVMGGFYLLATGKSIGLPNLGITWGTGSRGYGSILLFGVAYGIAAMSCTLQIFLVVISNALSEAGFTGAFLQFIVYSLGMGTVMVALTVGAALFKGSVAALLRRLLPYVEWLGTTLMVLAGGYVAAYWISDATLKPLGYFTGVGPALLAGILAVTLARWLLMRRAMQTSKP